MSVLRAAVFIVAFVLTGLPQARAQTQAPPAGPFHPMDALTVDEVVETVGIMKAKGLADENTRYPAITLREMSKALVRSWRRGDRFTRTAHIVSRRNAKTFETIVDLTKKILVSHREIPGAQPSLMDEEWQKARDLVLADEAWKKAVRKRGYADLSTIFCAPMSVGTLSGSETETRRLLNVPCYDTTTTPDNSYGRPIEGLIAVVDVDAGTVARIIDSGAVALPAPKAASKPQAQRFRPAMNPVVVFSPRGVNYKIDGGLNMEWQNWSFHVRAERRFGPVFSLVRFHDGKRNRDIAYQMSLSEMFVPYMDPDPQWSFRTLMDAGEYGLGYLASSLSPGRDCPRHSTFITVVMPSDTGGLFKVEKGLCVFERNTGDPLWRHASSQGTKVSGRPAIELVVRMIPTIGNYDYVIDWVFTQHGNIKIRVGATGYDAVKTVEAASMSSPTAESDTKYGTLLAPHTVAVYHDHLFSFRLDLDIDGPKNTLIRDNIKPVRLPKENRRRSIWAIERSPVVLEGPVRPGGHDENYRLSNPNRKTALGHNPSYHIEPGHGVLSLLAVDDIPQNRAAFSAERLWISRYKPGEIHAAGAYPNQSKGGDGLPEYVHDKESVTDTDVVVWYTMGFHHLTRVEDWPILPTKWHEFTLRPFNFFDRNPSFDVAPSFKRGQ